MGEFLGAFCVRVLWNSCGSVLREIKVFMGDFCRMFAGDFGRSFFFAEELSEI